MPITATTEYGRKRAEYIVKRLREGATVSQVASELGISPSSVKQYYYALGVRLRKRWSREEIEFVEQLMSRGVPYSKIAKIFGVTFDAIASLKKHYKLRRFRNLELSWAQTELEALHFLHECGYSVKLVESRTTYST